jgi:hypothetical protein
MGHKEELPWSVEARGLVAGEYEHYSGRRYRVIGVARHSETLEELVVYQALYGAGDRWVRPLSMFLGQVEVDGTQRPRFKKVA